MEDFPQALHHTSGISSSGVILVYATSAASFNIVIMARAKRVL